MSDLLYSDVELSLRDSVRAALKRRAPQEATALLYDDPSADRSAAWDALARDLGLAGLLISEDHGGAGASAREAAVVLEEIGRAVAPVPFLTSAVIATTALAVAGDETVLPRLAAGEVTAVLVLPWSARAGAWQAGEPGADIGPVAGALDADLFVVPVAGDDELELRVYSRDEVETTALTSLDMSRQLATVRTKGDGRLVLGGTSAVQAVDEALSTGQALLASEQYGIASWCLEATVDYVKTRIQFARPIGSFQAIKHRLADLFLQVTQAGAVARYAADTRARGDEDAATAQALAQAYCSDVAVHAAEEALQLHGGIGMTWEHPVHLYLKRAKADQLALGTPAVHRADLADLVDLPA
ncbi:acyl-CoA/acyl-ACP dehydrogenase [Aeromicrobium sp. YIM 150415]|uniref:acyl-CoA dehydrogenase family protein n=1 Tax=Aeromicrobium sp. YIM 150415 TaxID=2803912 RepID=UPI001966C3FF|nr:acyl-CoA dehydrogenase family protein [Aeromicrobium sp. YIM 150415]MBM9462051.1 acyl-CoA/acyl-ACP dehydrogenase [Aeromicrobium sp. YIM 150415]